MTRTKKEQALMEIFALMDMTSEKISTTTKKLNYKQMRNVELCIKALKFISDGTDNSELGNQAHNFYAWLLRKFIYIMENRTDIEIINKEGELIYQSMAEGLKKNNIDFYLTLEE